MLRFSPRYATLPHFFLESGARLGIAAEGVADPRAGKGPVSVGGTAANPHYLGRVGKRQAREGPKLDQRCPGWILARQGVQGLVEGKQILAGRISQKALEV